MGLLDEAIREHLELKRRRGADAGEISREESEALGPVRRAPDGTPDLASIATPPPAASAPPVAEPAPARDADPPGFGDDEPDWGDETVAHTPPPIPARPSQPPSHPEPPASGYVMPPALPTPEQQRDEFDDSAPLPPLDEEPEPDPAPRGKTRRLPGAGRLRLRRGRGEQREPSPEPEPDPNPPDFGADYDPPGAAPERRYEPPPVAYQPPPAREPDVVHPDDEPAGEDLLEETPEFLEETPDHDRLWFEQRPPRDFDFDK
jgi:hypothetical protein